MACMLRRSGSGGCLYVARLCSYPAYPLIGAVDGGTARSTVHHATTWMRPREAGDRPHSMLEGAPVPLVRLLSPKSAAAPSHALLQCSAPLPQYLT